MIEANGHDRPVPGILRAAELGAFDGYRPGNATHLEGQVPAGRLSATSLVGMRRTETQVAPPVDAAPVHAAGTVAVPNVIEVHIDPNARTFHITPGDRIQQ